MECENCTMCCHLLHIHEVKSKAGNWCEYCIPGSGCIIYPDRPEECKQYNCSWKLMEKTKPELRPDRCKIIFEPVNDHIMFGLHHPDYEMKPITKAQIVAFLKLGSSVVIEYLNGNKPDIAVAKGHTGSQIWRETLEKYKEYINDRSKLHN